MLYPPTTDLPLFSCSYDEIASSSMRAAASGPLSPRSSSLPCGMQDRVISIQVHSSTESFSWSDFPIVHHQKDYHRVLDATSVNESEEDENGSSLSSCDDASVCSSIGSLDVIPSEESSSKNSSSNNNNGSKRVHFSSTMEVRTYSIVLGDHPLCRALPISLGWDYNAEPALVDLDTHEDYKWSSSNDATSPSPSSSSLPYVRRLSYLERKELLLTVGNLSLEDVRNAEDGNGTGAKVSPSSRPSNRYSTSHSDLCALLEQPPPQRR